MDGKAVFLLRKLYKAYLNRPLQLPDYVLIGFARREKVRLGPDVSATSPIFAVMRNVIPAPGGRYVDDLDVDFQILDGGTNHPVLEARTSAARIDLGRFDEKRVRFRIDAFPYDPGKYWVTVGLSNRSTGHLYHVQTQRYLFEVFDAPRVQDRVEVPVAVDAEDL